MKIINNLKLKIKNCKEGFTLVELLIVVAIIGVLATLLMANFIGVRQRARDAERKSDIRQIQSALELYRSDQSTYPASPLASCGQALQGGSPVSTYMQKIPCDPSGYNSGNYVYTSSSTTYQLCACLENTSDSQGQNSCPGNNFTCSSNWYYVVTNP